MTDSNSFTSLFALVDSHLSKCNVQQSDSAGDGRVSIPIPSLNGVHRGMSDTLLGSPGQRLPIPSLSLSESPISTVLSVQISNMLKAKELKKQKDQEKQNLEEEMRKLKLEEDNCVIDLMKAVQIPGQPKPKPCKETLSSSSSFESLFLDNPEFICSPSESDSKIAKKPSLPCITDMSYILHNKKIKMGKGSAFGKVLSSRLRPVAAPYLREIVKSDIVRFDFSTKSPCDLIKEKLKKKPAIYTQSNFVLEFLNSNQ